MENRSFLKLAAAALKGRLPLLAGLLVGWLTVAAWALPPLLVSQFAMFTGEGSGIFIVFLPLWLSGDLFGGLMMQLCKLDPATHQSLGQALTVIGSIQINGGLAWAAITLVCTVGGVVKRRRTIVNKTFSPDV